jgi:hypothetical protein
MESSSNQLNPVIEIGRSQVAVARPDPGDSAKISLILAGIIVIALAGFLGGMQYLIVILALGLSILILQKPQEALPAGWLFMLAAMTLLPVTGRFHYIDAQTEGIDWQQYFWAAGSLIVVIAALYKVGVSRVLQAPAFCQAFLVVALISGIFGFSRGNNVSYVARQLYGSILFAVYFVIAWAIGDERLLFRRLRTYGVLIAFAFIVYYISVFAEWGFHKEDTSLPIQMGMVAALFFAKGWFDKKLGWLAPSAILLLASFLLFFRNILLTFCFAAALAMAMQSSSRIWRALCFGVATLILLPSVLPFGAQYALNIVEDKAPELYDMLPEGTHDTKTLTDRSIQLAASAALLLQSPVLGQGMGNEFRWTSDLGDRDQAFVDNGWAYLAVKMGFLGILAFGWLLVSTLRCMSKQSLPISITLLAILSIAMFSEPVCFQFTMSPIAGGLAGLLYAGKHPLLPTQLERAR